MRDRLAASKRGLRSWLRAWLLAAVVLVLSFVATSPASAVSSWSIAAASGKMSGSFSSNPINGYWHISGTLKDYYSGDDCTRGQIYVGSNLTWSKKLCGAASQTFDLQGYTNADSLWVIVCRQGTIRSYCTDKTLYLE